MRASASSKPRTEPPTKAMTERPMVHSAPKAMNSIWVEVRCMSGSSSDGRAELAAAGEDEETQQGEGRPHHEGEDDVEDPGDDVGLERAERVGLDAVGDRRQFLGGNLRG